jgi:hypothetical protein
MQIRLDTIMNSRTLKQKLTNSNSRRTSDLQTGSLEATRTNQPRSSQSLSQPPLARETEWRPLLRKPPSSRKDSPQPKNRTPPSSPSTSKRTRTRPRLPRPSFLHRLNSPSSPWTTSVRQPPNTLPPSLQTLMQNDKDGGDSQASLIRIFRSLGMLSCTLSLSCHTLVSNPLSTLHLTIRNTQAIQLERIPTLI